MYKYKFEEVAEQLKKNPSFPDHSHELPRGSYPFLWIHFDDAELATRFLDKLCDEFGFRATSFAYNVAEEGHGWFKKGEDRHIFGVVNNDIEFINSLNGEFVIELSDINMGDVDDEAFAALLEC